MKCFVFFCPAGVVSFLRRQTEEAALRNCRACRRLKHLPLFHHFLFFFLRTTDVHSFCYTVIVCFCPSLWCHDIVNVYINIYANKCKPETLVVLSLVFFFLIFSFVCSSESHIMSCFQLMQVLTSKNGNVLWFVKCSENVFSSSLSICLVV